MKKLCQTLILGGLIAASNIALAKDGICPSPAALKANADFVIAEKVSDQDNFWGFMSQNFNHQDMDWNFFYFGHIDLDESQDVRTAGQKHFIENVQLKEPDEISNNGVTLCYYSDFEGGAMEMTLAFNPPIDLPQARSYLRRR